MASRTVFNFAALVFLALIASAYASSSTKACEDLKMRFACRARPDCQWLGGQSICVTGDPNATASPVTPTTHKPTKTPTTRSPTPLKTRVPTRVPTVKTKAPTYSPGTIITRSPTTHRPTHAPTLRQCSTITTRQQCVSGVGAGRCEWTGTKCIVIRTAKPSKSPTTSQPTSAPSHTPSVAPSHAPTKAHQCKEYKTVRDCCGKAYADGTSKVCKNKFVAFPGCKWKTKNVPKPVCVAATMPPTTAAPTPKATTAHPTTARPTPKSTPAPTPKGGKVTKKPTNKPTKYPTHGPTKKGQTFSPTEYEYEY